MSEQRQKTAGLEQLDCERHHVLIILNRHTDQASIKTDSFVPASLTVFLGSNQQTMVARWGQIQQTNLSYFIHLAAKTYYQ